MYAALTVRTLKPGSYDEWRQAWESGGEDQWPEGAGNAYILRNVNDPDEVIAFGFFAGDMEALRDDLLGRGGLLLDLIRRRAALLERLAELRGVRLRRGNRLGLTTPSQIRHQAGQADHAEQPCQRASHGADATVPRASCHAPRRAPGRRTQGGADESKGR